MTRSMVPTELAGCTGSEGTSWGRNAPPLNSSLPSRTTWVQRDKVQLRQVLDLSAPSSIAGNQSLSMGKRKMPLVHTAFLTIAAPSPLVPPPTTVTKRDASKPSSWHLKEGTFFFSIL